MDHKNVIVSITVFLIMLLMCEFIISVFYPQNLYTRTYDEYLGERMIANNQTYVTPEKTWTAQVNEYGWRDQYYPKNKTRTRIMVYGDSFVFGSMVEQNQTFTKLIEQHKNVDVMNLGASGKGLEYYYLLMKQTIPEYKPDKVIVTIFVGNDFNKHVLVTPNTFEPIPQHPSLQLRIRRWLAMNSHLYNLFISVTFQKSDWLALQTHPNVIQRTEDFLLYPEDVFDKNKEQVEMLLMMMKKLCRGNNASFMVVIIPPRIMIQQGINNTYQVDYYEHGLQQYLNKNGIKYMNVQDNVSDVKDWYYQYDGHFTPMGNERLAALIEQKWT